MRYTSLSSMSARCLAFSLASRSTSRLYSRSASSFFVSFESLIAQMGGCCQQIASACCQSGCIHRLGWRQTVGTSPHACQQEDCTSTFNPSGTAGNVLNRMHVAHAVGTTHPNIISSSRIESSSSCSLASSRFLRYSCREKSRSRGSRLSRSSSVSYFRRFASCA